MPRSRCHWYLKVLPTPSQVPWRAVSADPRFGQRNANLGDLIVASMPVCISQVRAMIEAYDRYFGDGEGEAFFMGPYLDVLPSAVTKWVRDAVK